MSHGKISNISCRGEFEMQRSEKLPSSCYGMQAHLSTNASPKVLEVSQASSKNYIGGSTSLKCLANSVLSKSCHRR